MKRFVCVLLAVFLMLSLLPTAAFAAKDQFEETEQVFKVIASGSAFAKGGVFYKTTLSQAEVYDYSGNKTRLSVTTTELYTSSTLNRATKLSHEPQVGVTYYFGIQVPLSDEETGKTYGYHEGGIRTRSSVTIDGYDVENLTVTEIGGGTSILLTCSATKKASPVKITGLKVTGNSYEYISYTCYIDDPSATLVTEKGELFFDSYSALHTDAKCENKLKTAPEAGKTYYMFLRFNPKNVNYKDAITAAKTSIDVKGYTDAKIVKTDISATKIDVYISLKYADTAAAKPKLTHILFRSNGFRQDSSLGTYFPADPKVTIRSDKGTVDMNTEISCFYTDSACSKQLKAAPTVGKTYYFTITLNHEAGAFENAISSVDSEIGITDFTDCKLVSAKSNGDRGVLVLCSGKYVGEQRKLLGIELTATGLSHDTSLGVYFPSISKLSGITDMRKQYMEHSVSRLYKNSACTKDLKTAPEDGQTYYFTVSLRHGEGDYENAIKNSNSSIQITGFSDCKVVKAEADPGYGTKVYCSVTYGKSAKPPVETTAPATDPTAPTETIAATEPTESIAATDPTDPTEEDSNATEPVAGQPAQEDSGMPWWGLLIIVAMVCGTAIAIVLILKKKKDE